MIQISYFEEEGPKGYQGSASGGILQVLFLNGHNPFFLDWWHCDTIFFWFFFNSTISIKFCWWHIYFFVFLQQHHVNEWWFFGLVTHAAHVFLKHIHVNEWWFVPWSCSTCIIGTSLPWCLADPCRVGDILGPWWQRNRWRALCQLWLRTAHRHGEERGTVKHRETWGIWQARSWLVACGQAKAMNCYESTGDFGNGW